MIKNLGNVVSRVLDIRDRNYNGVVFQQKRPPLDSECILSQDIDLGKISEILKATTPSGFLTLQDIKGAPANRTLINSAWVNVIIINNPILIINGWIVKVGGGTNQIQPNTQQNIWKTLSNNTDEVAIIGDPTPHLGAREDLVFIEVWQKLITPADPIYNYGFVQSALPNFPNDLIDPNIEIETTKRIQIQYRIRWVDGVDFVSYRNGLGFPGCYAQGPSGVNNTSYVYTQSSTDPGLWTVGDGTETSQTNLGTVDGYIYAVPIARVHRRNRSAFSLSNLNGSAYSILSGHKSDRPDGLFYDEISVNDVEDLRHRISLTGWDYSYLLETSLDQLWSKNLTSELKYSPQDENLFGHKLIQADGISSQGITGVDNTNRVPDSTARVFSEARETQVVSFNVASVIINNTTSYKVWFTPIGHQENSYEYQLFNDQRYYIASSVPRVRVYDTTANTITQLYGGTWQGLGIATPWDFSTNVNHNKITYTPTTISLIQNKSVVFEFDFVVREGGGIGATVGGFTHQIDTMYSGHNNKDNSIVDFNLYNEDYSVIDLVSPRVTGPFTDSAISRSIHSFEAAANPASTSMSKYKAGIVELSYYKTSTGSSNDTIPSTLYARNVLSIFSIQNITQSIYVAPTIIIQSDKSFVIEGIESDVGDILEYTILLGNYSIDYVPYTRGIKNIVTAYNFSASIASGATTGILNLKTINVLCDAGIASAGFYDGISYRFIAYVNNIMVFLDSINGLGSALLQYNLTSPATSAGSIALPVIGYYSPSTSDLLYFIYAYKTYAGMIQTRLLAGAVQQVKVLKMDDKVAITTAGTGSEVQYVADVYANLVEALPLDSRLLEYNLFGDNIDTSVSGGISALRRIAARGVSNLREGVILNLELGTVDTEMLRGVVIASPDVLETDIVLTTPTNHINQWTAIVEGMGILKGELFLMVITTFSSIYNVTEGPQYKYLELKNIYADNALGKGSETIINNTLTGTNLSQNIGNKIYGAVDLFPLKYRPIVYSTI